MDGFGFGDIGLFDSLGVDVGAFDTTGRGRDALGPELIESSVWSRPIMPRIENVSYDHAIDMARELSFDNDTEIFAFVSGNFVFGDLLEALVDERKVDIRHLGIMTLSLSDENIDSLVNIIEMTPLETLHIVLSDYWYSHEVHPGGLVQYLFEQLDIDGVELKVAFAHVHCKVATIETMRGNHLTMEGSANLRSSGNVEQMHISPDPRLWEFCHNFQENVIEQYDVVNQENRINHKRDRSLRREELWRVTDISTKDSSTLVQSKAEAAAGAAEAAVAEAHEAGARPE